MTPRRELQLELLRIESLARTQPSTSAGMFRCRILQSVITNIKEVLRNNCLFDVQMEIMSAKNWR